jgi:hypothetical protein
MLIDSSTLLIRKEDAMALDLTEENLKKAYCASLLCTGIGAAASQCDSVMPQIVKKVVPQIMQDDFPTRLLVCATKVCSGEPYGWRVVQSVPTLGDTTTFQQLFDEWFKTIVRPPIKPVN